mgnify:CR=1 FL=1
MVDLPKFSQDSVNKAKGADSSFVKPNSKKPKVTLIFLLIVLLSFGYYSKNFQLDASSDTLLLENDPDLTFNFTEFLFSVDSITSPVASTFEPSVNSIEAPAVNVALELNTTLIDKVVASNKPLSSKLHTTSSRTRTLPSSTSQKTVP